MLAGNLFCAFRTHNHHSAHLTVHDMPASLIATRWKRIFIGVRHDGIRAFDDGFLDPRPKRKALLVIDTFAKDCDAWIAQAFHKILII
ncbi:hypothetical protein ASC97_01410 [Rhizobium sp. Root1203]|nr:hypothetical protein ASC97_01410 [Rhizobium sp. Root1203]